MLPLAARIDRMVLRLKRMLLRSSKLNLHQIQHLRIAPVPANALLHQRSFFHRSHGAYPCSSLSSVPLHPGDATPLPLARVRQAHNRLPVRHSPAETPNLIPQESPGSDVNGNRERRWMDVTPRLGSDASLSPEHSLRM